MTDKNNTNPFQALQDTARAQLTQAAHEYITELFSDLPAEQDHAFLWNEVRLAVLEGAFDAMITQCHGNQSQIANIMGINRATLRAWLEQAGKHQQAREALIRPIK
ncbi:MAG: hypothetical protein BWK73_25585 [Thiothrix lacustris]|uniref:DNA binding HTH domain-containing protein n=1 Tax=Thiothrix lacustris TaxID=525917 RepID=A0A1Y1QL84_9GAMM|nr:MAG: hypothetical protein BWK73_25585 [Thiothrix lacustris]